ncbi:MAG: zf-HC2 domain-containing protein [Thermoanaerobaculia bacterium]
MTTYRPDCDATQHQIDLAFAGELPDEERRNLMRHVDECTDCHSYYDVVEELASPTIEEPDAAGYLAMRREVIRTIRREAAEDSPRASWFPIGVFSHPGGFALALAAAGVLFALGVLAGRAGTSVPTPGASRQPAGADAVLARQIGTAAKNNRVLQDVENSPFRYSNVRIEERDDQQLRLSFDVSRHLDLTLRRDDPLVTEVLVQSVLDPSAVGTQLKAISEAGNVLDPRVRGALVKAMLTDPNLGVRLQAQSRLAETTDHDETAAAMLSVLEREASVQMRLIAIDYLAGSHVDPQRLERAVAAGEPEGRAAVYVKARNYIQSF